ncbi:hypothetical protein [Pseudomonas phage PhL_UNISO_PA-DSM_ph0031]|nr:hypothetical protein [Pseudomonas phage PhL_UNISO_PA-DSM_ph0031]
MMNSCLWRRHTEPTGSQPRPPQAWRAVADFQGFGGPTMDQQTAPKIEPDPANHVAMALQSALQLFNFAFARFDDSSKLLNFQFQIGLSSHIHLRKGNRLRLQEARRLLLSLSGRVCTRPILPYGDNACTNRNK